jgi:hypothetical protein
VYEKRDEIFVFICITSSFKRYITRQVYQNRCLKAQLAHFNFYQISHVLTHSVVDPHHIDADPDSDFYLMRMRILLLTLMLIRILIQILASKKRLEPLKKCSNRLIVHTFWLVICKMMRIRIRFGTQLITLMRIRIRFRTQLITLMRIRIRIRTQLITLMRIRIRFRTQLITLMRIRILIFI